jgi:hypothetical protein
MDASEDAAQWPDHAAGGLVSNERNSYFKPAFAKIDSRHKEHADRSPEGGTATEEEFREQERPDPLRSRIDKMRDFKAIVK